LTIREKVSLGIIHKRPPYKILKN